MNISVCIVDDDPMEIKNLVSILGKLPDIRVIASETDPIVAISKIMSGVIKVDVIFVDIDMPDLNGLEFSKQIGNRAVVIFVTAHAGYALEAFGTDAADFITKPVDINELLRAIQKAREKLVARDKLFVTSFDRYLFLKLGVRLLRRINLKDLLYVEVNGKYVDIHILGEKPLTVKKSLTFIDELLPKDLFIRISKSCIVNSVRISEIAVDRLILDSGSVHTIGITYLNDVFSRFGSL